MASTTTNLGLTKPAYSDDADLSDINGNMDLIDAEAGKVRANVAANYDSSETYAVGDYCLHDGSLQRVLQTEKVQGFLAPDLLPQCRQRGVRRDHLLLCRFDFSHVFLSPFNPVLREIINCTRTKPISSTDN